MADLQKLLDRSAKSEADDVVEAAGEIFGGDVGAIVGEFLLDADGPGLAGFGLEIRIAEVAELVIEDLIEARLLDALTVENAEGEFRPRNRGPAERAREAPARGTTRVPKYSLASARAPKFSDARG